MIRGCPENVASVCKCTLAGNDLQVDCSQLTLTEAVKRLEEANLHIKSFEMHDNSLLREIPAKLFSKLSISQLDFSSNYIARVSVFIEQNCFIR